MSAPPLVAAKLVLPPGSTCLRADVWVGFDEVPFSLATSYLPARFEVPFRDAAAGASFSGDWYELLESMGEELASSAMNIESITADDLVAPWLGVEAGAPLVLFTRLIVAADGVPVEYGFVRVRADRVMLEVPLPRASPAPATGPAAPNVPPAQLTEETDR